MAKIQIADGKISSSADYSLYHGTTKVADIKQNAISGSSSSTGSFGAVHIGGATDYKFQMNPPSSAATEVISARLSTLYIAGADGHPELSSGASAGSLTLAAAGVGNNSPRIETYGHNHASKAAQIRFATLDTDRMTISSSGEVGIGTASPGRKLHIHGSTNSNSGGAHVYYTTAADAYPIMATYGYSHDNMTRSFDMYINDAGQWISSDAGSNFDIAKGGDKLLFRYNSGTAAGSVMSAFPTAIAINTSGNVGIGTSSPTGSLLHVVSNASDGATFGIGYINTGNNFIAGNVLGSINFGGQDNSDTNHRSIQIQAKVAATWGGNSQTDLHFKTYDAGVIDAMTILSSGNVGIGTDSPDYKLQVDGDIAPETTNTYDLGAPSLRWANIYTSDLHLKNEKGDWTVEEGEDDLFITNNKTGKKFKFKLEEVT